MGRKSHTRRGVGGHRRIANVAFLVLAIILFAIAAVIISGRTSLDNENGVAGAIGIAFADSAFRSMGTVAFGIAGLVCLLLAAFYKSR